MEFQNEPLPQPPSDFLRSTALFVFTMGTVFGLGLVWTNYGDQIAFRWRKDWNGMKQSWTESTTPQKQNRGASFFGAIPGHPWGKDGFGYEMKPADNSPLRSDRPVVPMIDSRKPDR
jgi:nitrate reductase alpha subunit